MTITIDLRSIQRGILSGVETYAYNVTEHLLRLDEKNHFRLFYNFFRTIPLPDLHFLNSENTVGRIPNRVLALTSLFGYPKLEAYSKADTGGVFWMPNLAHGSVGPKVKLVLTVHDVSPFIRPEFYDVKRRVWHKTANFAKLVRRADKILAVSEYTKNDLVEHFHLPAGKIFVTHLGVNRQVYTPELSEQNLRLVRNSYSLPAEFFLYLGTLEPRKNLVGLIKAFELAKTPAHLVIAGRPGWKYKEIFRTAQKSPKKNKIHFLGFVRESDKPYLMKLSSAFVFPSFYEGFGLPALEAQSVGVPVVTGSLTSLPEVVGDSALLANPYRTDEMAFAMEQVIQDEVLREVLVRRGFENSQRFSWQKCAEQTHKVLTEW